MPENSPRSATTNCNPWRRRAWPALLLLALLLAAGCRPIEAGRGGQAAAIGSGGEEREQGAGGQRDQRSGEGRSDASVLAQPVAWDAAPACQNQPQTRAAWRSEFEASSANNAVETRQQMLLDQMQRYTRLLPAYTPESMAALLAGVSADAEGRRQQALAVLWLNLVDERLNRATGLGGEPAALAPSVGALIDLLVAAPAGSAELDALLELAATVNGGQGLASPVCARLIYRSEDALHTAQWNDQGASAASEPLAAPDGFTTFSPDYSQLVVQTPRGDTAGGPLYLYDLATEQITNLNEQSNLPSYTSISALKIVGWRPDNGALLLANEDDEVTIWLDLASGAYQPLDLGIDTSQMAAPRGLTPAPDGSGFAFLTYDRSSDAANLYWYDVPSAASRLVQTVPAEDGKLDGLQISPDGRQAVYVLHKGSRRAGRSEELRLVDLETGASRVLLSGHLGPLRPVWSPDGQQLAFVRRNMDKPVTPGPQVSMPLGDLWTIRVASGELQQLTDIQAITHAPTWSTAGKRLAFVTASGELGLVGVEQPGAVWQLDAHLAQPQFTQVGFLP